MRILVTTNKNNFENLPTAVTIVRQKVSAAIEVVNGEDVPWDSVLETEGGWDGVFQWTNRSFTALVLLEGEDGLGRGCYEMAKMFLDNKKSVGVVRNGKICEVKEVRVYDKDRWTDSYGIACT